MSRKVRATRGKRDPFHAHLTEKASGRYYLTLGPANANGVVSFGLTPAFLGARLADLANLFLEFRFTGLRITWLSSTTTLVGYYAVYEPSVPTSLVEASETDYVKPCFATQLMPARYRVPADALLGNRTINWFRTIPAAGADDNLEYQGMMFAAGLAVSAYLNVFVEYDIEFRGRAPGVVSVTRPLAERQRQYARDSVNDALPRPDDGETSDQWEDSDLPEQKSMTPPSRVDKRSTKSSLAVGSNAGLGRGRPVARPVVSSIVGSSTGP